MRGSLSRHSTRRTGFLPRLDHPLRIDGVCGLAHSEVADRATERRIALAFFFVQLALNALWSWLFFGLNNPLAGLLNIVPQLLIILVTIERFRRLDPVAAACLVPLAAWVAFASLLNFEIWRLNG